jgi:hypothetical protein
MHSLRVTAHQVVPQQQVLAFGHQAISAGGRQPLELVGLIGRQLDAVGDELATVGVIRATAGVQVQQFAGDARVVNAAVVFVFQFLQAAQAAAVAQRLPLILIELGEGFTFPEGFDFGGHGSTTEFCKRSAV